MINRILKALFTFALLIGMAVFAMAQSNDDQKKPPPKKDPPKIKIPPKRPPPKEDRPKPKRPPSGSEEIQYFVRED